MNHRSSPWSRKSTSVDASRSLVRSGGTRDTVPPHATLLRVPVTITDDELVLSKHGNLVEVEVDPAATAPRTIPVVVPVIEPTVPMVVIAVTPTAPVVIAIRPSVVPDQLPNQTAEAALAQAVAPITIEHIKQVVEHGEPLSSLRSWVHKNPGRIPTDEPGSGQARRVSRFCRRSACARTDDGSSAPGRDVGYSPCCATVYHVAADDFGLMTRWRYLRAGLDRAGRVAGRIG